MAKQFLFEFFNILSQNSTIVNMYYSDANTLNQVGFCIVSVLVIFICKHIFDCLYTYFTI